MLIRLSLFISIFAWAECLAMEPNLHAQVEQMYKKSSTELPVNKLPVSITGENNINLWVAIPPGFINPKGPLFVADQIEFLLPDSSTPNVACEKITTSFLRTWPHGQKLIAHLKKQEKLLRDKLKAEILVSECESKDRFTIGKLVASYSNNTEQLFYTFFVLGSHCSNIIYEITLTPKIDQAQALAKVEAFIKNNTCIK